MATTTAAQRERITSAGSRNYSEAAERRTWRLFGLIAIMVAMWLGFNHITGGAFLTPRNLTNLTVQASITGIVAIGVGVLLIARELDLSVGSILGAVVVFTAWAQVQERWSALPAILAALAIGAATGLFQGLCTTKLRVPSFIVTLAGFSYLRGVAYGITGSVTLFGLSNGVIWFSEGTFSKAVTIVALLAVFLALALAWLWQRWLHYQGQGFRRLTRSVRPVEIASWVLGAALCAFALWIYSAFQGLPAPVAILIVVALVTAFVARHTAFGRHVYAIGGNPEAARRAGIKVDRVVVVLFVASGTLAALGGIIQAARLGAGPPNVGLLLALDAISAAVVGGTYLFGGQGRISGILVGTLFLASIQNGLNLRGVSTFWQYIVSGVVLLAAVAIEQVTQLRAQRD
jgi:D-xylose transport system permease protein